ncbi:MAG: DNA cytosine methyltransferase [Oscillatoriales cyanobacterium]|uniref:Cytosine-specific methyltransferase n=1 Tax=Microcoleus anatoxicus PTRS2 TaxID=2705321 RepID=A0ABU8YL38_9CYAN|nr:MAG: DNA cytosine methyltransferase [Oscillatoriales cyanobacterium]TAE03316.1 MAG: DNA cytosine methyltransferase [Oscillatoriales cyanobacterium]
MPSNRKKRPIAVDLFAGAGGMTLGFEQAGFDVLASVEIDPIHCATHQFNFPNCSILCKDVALLTGAEIRKNSPIGKRQIDVVIGGSPCQGFSMMGKRDVDDPRNSLIFHFQRLVLELKPKFFVMENVPGIKAGEHKGLLDFLISSFIEAGYQVEENYQVLNSAHYGVPQARKRLFLLGSKAGCELPQYPPPITLLPKLNQKIEPSNRKRKGKNNPDLPLVPTVMEAIGDLPEVELYSELLYRDWVMAEYGKSSNYASIMRGIDSFDDDYSYPREYDRQILSSSWRTKHSQECIERFMAAKHGEKEPIGRFYKLHPDGVCNTLRAGTDRARGAYTSPRPIHPTAPRCITVREAARLHSYPDWFRFHVTKWHGFRQVGNSVPPLLAKAVGAQIIRALGVQVIKPTAKLTWGDDGLLKLNWLEAEKYYQNRGG